MAFNFFKWILRKTDPGENATSVDISTGDFLDAEPCAVAGLEIYLQRMAFWACVRKIGSAVAAVEWQTYRRGKKVKAKEYWAWNHSPNPNETKTEFFQKLIGQLYEHQEALIVETHGGYRYVADSFTVQNYLSGNLYKDITARGESIPGTFAASDVIHISISGEHIKRILTTIAVAEGQLMKSSASNFVRSNGMRGTLTIDDLAEADPDFEDTYEDLVNEKFKKYFTAENAVLPLFRGYQFTEREKGTRGSSSQTTRDFRAMMDDIIELTAIAIGMPASIATGKNVTEEDFKTFMTHIIQPIVRMIEEGINNQLYGRELVFNGTYTSANVAGIEYNDLFDVANPIDKLIGSGAFCINDIRMRLGLDIIDEPWAWQHWMTKNYSTVEDLNIGVDDSKKNIPEAQPGKEEEHEQEQEDDDE